MSSKRVLILKASPRRRGNSTILADQAAAGAKAAGAVVESFLLHDMDIKPCDGCDGCKNNDNGQCVIGDDMDILYPRLRQADAIIVASPIYWFTICAQAKLCIDRWYALETSQGSALKGKQFGIILTYGDDDLLLSGAINAVRTFQDMCRYLKADLAGMVYGSVSDEGAVEKMPVLMEQAYKLGQKLGAS